MHENVKLLKSLDFILIKITKLGLQSSVCCDTLGNVLDDHHNFSIIFELKKKVKNR